MTWCSSCNEVYNSWIIKFLNKPKPDKFTIIYSIENIYFYVKFKYKFFLLMTLEKICVYIGSFSTCYEKHILLIWCLPCHHCRTPTWGDVLFFCKLKKHAYQ